MIRRFFVWLHRWTGLLMAGFLIIVGLTGSVLAFRSDLERLISPQLYATPATENARSLDFATLAERAELIVPHGRTNSVAIAEPGQAIVTMEPRKNPSTNEPYELGFTQLFLDPWTGKLLGQRNWGDISQGFVNLIPFVYNLHKRLAWNHWAAWVLGVVALVWTFDCFVGLYLTLPTVIASFWRRWRPAWLIKQKAGAFRLNFDLHRASGLWLWPALFVFAWSSVFFNLTPVYEWATRATFDYRSGLDDLNEFFLPQPHPGETPLLDWHAAQAIAERLMVEQASSHSFFVIQPVSLDLVSGNVYWYSVRSSRDVREHGAMTWLMFDADTGALRRLILPTGEHIGNTLTNWLWALHFGDVLGLPFRIFVCALGLVIVMLSVTGVYIWWKKRSARVLRARRGLKSSVLTG